MVKLGTTKRATRDNVFVDQLGPHMRGEHFYQRKDGSRVVHLVTEKSEVLERVWTYGKVENCTDRIEWH